MAAGELESPERHRALEVLCGIYWYPIYAYARRRGHSPADAEDLTQEFLLRLVAKEALTTVDRKKGRFRSFVLASFNHFLANEWDKARSVKRGGGRRILSLDTAETRYCSEPSESMSADRMFERKWAMTLLAQVMARLRENYRDAGKERLFDELQIYLSGERGLPSYGETAARLQLSIDAMKKAVERLRRRYGELLREEIAQTVSDSAEVDDEIRHLKVVLSS